MHRNTTIGHHKFLSKHLQSNLFLEEFPDCISRQRQAQLTHLFQAAKEVAMSTAKTPQKTAPSQIVKLDKALKLAEQWVNNMTNSAEDEPTEVETESRPSRLGLGAKVSRQIKLGPSNDPVERKLFAKLDAEKRKAAKSTKELIPSAGGGSDDDNDDDDDLESRTSAFSKKRAIPPTSSLQATKKHK